MLLREAIEIDAQDTTGSLHDKLAALGARMIVSALSLAQRGELQAVPQPAVGVTYAHKIDKAESAVDWRQSAEVIARRVRAFNPFPAVGFQCKGETLKVWAAHVATDLVAGATMAGQVVAVTDQGIRVACGEGQLLLTQLQRPGGKRLPVADFLRGFELQAGQLLS